MLAARIELRVDNAEKVKKKRAKQEGKKKAKAMRQRQASFGETIQLCGPSHSWLHVKRDLWRCSPPRTHDPQPTGNHTPDTTSLRHANTENPDSETPQINKDATTGRVNNRQPHKCAFAWAAKRTAALRVPRRGVPHRTRTLAMHTDHPNIYPVTTDFNPKGAHANTITCKTNYNLQRDIQGNAFI